MSDDPTRSSAVRSSWKTALAAGLFVVVVIVTAWIGRVSEGRKSIASCDAAVARADLVEAIVFAREAAESRCPWCAAPELGYARLYAIAKEGEARGDDALAVASWRAVRAASLATTVLDPTPARRERADVEIARLEHRLDAKAAAAGGVPAPAASEERLRVALAARAIPSSTVFVLLAVGFVLFLAGAIRFVRAKSSRNAAELVMATAGGALAAIGVLLF